MTLFVQSTPAPLVEPAVVPEITCSGLARIEFMGSGLCCFLLYRNAVGPSEERERQICGRVFAPLEAVPEAVQLMMRALAEGGAAELASWPMRLLS